VADGGIVDTTSMDIFQRLGISRIEEQRMCPECDRRINLAVVGAMIRVGLSGWALVARARYSLARADFLTEQLF
jgi:hypothetical protein